MGRPRIQPFRDETLKDALELRNRLNEAVRAINEASARWVALRVPSVQDGMDVTVEPGFVVGAIVIGGVSRVDGGTLPAAAPWVTDIRTDGGGRVLFKVGGLSAGAQYVVNVLCFELESAR